MIKLYNTITDKNGQEITISEILKIITSSDRNSILIDILRKSNTKEEYTENKKKLLSAYTPNALFGNSRKNNDLLKSSKFMFIDIDNLEDINEVKSILGCDRYIYSLWVSPSGKGLGGLVKIPEVLSNEEFKKIYKTFSFYIKQKYNYILDNKCSNLNRINFISFDKDLFLNENSKIFNFNDYYDEIKKEESKKEEKQLKKIKEKFPNANITSHNHYDILIPLPENEYRTKIYIEDFKDLNKDNLKYDNNAYVYEKGLPVPNLFIGNRKSWKDGNRNKFFFLHILSFLYINPNISLNTLITYSLILMDHAFCEKWSNDTLIKKVKEIYENYINGEYSQPDFFITKYTFFSKDCDLNRSQKIKITKEYTSKILKNHIEECLEEKIHYTYENTEKFINKTSISEDTFVDKKYSYKKVCKYWTNLHENTSQLMNNSRYSFDTKDIKITKKLKQLLDIAIILNKKNKKFTKAHLTKESKCSPNTISKYWDDIQILLKEIK